MGVRGVRMSLDRRKLLVRVLAASAGLKPWGRAPAQERSRPDAQQSG
jgi:hypothetical protein